ncbi:MAG: hypothetical protein E5W09_07065 [Mesorhizobium sp.]|nr:MAG: hypothetical protein E5W09_07065 [Mesorhizobium sp.]
MTILSVELNKLVNPDNGHRFDVVYICADSRVTRGQTVTTELAPKILPVHMAVGNKHGERHYFPPYGFGFAGSVLSASLTHGVAEHCLMAVRPAVIGDGRGQTQIVTTH